MLRLERQIPREGLSISGYWRLRPRRGRLAGVQARVERTRWSGAGGRRPPPPDDTRPAPEAAAPHGGAAASCWLTPTAGTT